MPFSTHNHAKQKICHSQLIYGFIQTQHEHQSHKSFPILHTLFSPWISLTYVKFPSHFLSGTMLHFHAVLLALHNSYKQQPIRFCRKSAIQQHTTLPRPNPPTSCSLCSPSALVFTITSCAYCPSLCSQPVSVCPCFHHYFLCSLLVLVLTAHPCVLS